MIPGGCDEQYSCNADIQLFVKVTRIALCFFQCVHNAPRHCKEAPWSLPHRASRTHMHRRLKPLEEVVGKQLGAPYTCQLFPETGQIVLTPEKESRSPGSAMELTYGTTPNNYGMRDAVVAATGKSPAVVARTLLQPILNAAWLAAKTCTRGAVNS